MFRFIYQRQTSETQTSGNLPTVIFKPIFLPLSQLQPQPVRILIECWNLAIFQHCKDSKLQKKLVLKGELRITLHYFALEPSISDFSFYE